MTSASTKSQASNYQGAEIQRATTDDTNRSVAALTARFTILKSTGAKEDSEFYLAKDRSRQRLVKLRVLSDDAARNPARLKLFYAEARAAARLSYPNIAKTDEAARIGQVQYCAVEHRGEAESLRSLLDQTGWFDIPHALNVARQIIGAIEYAHSRGIWHLGLRPEDVFIKPDGEVMLAGFGIESSDDLVWAHRERSRDCPASYISPEQIEARRIDHRADLYALGILIFEMLTDRVPFDSHDPDLIRQKHLTRAPEPPSVYREGIPEPLSDLVLDLLEKNPDERIRKVTSYGSLLNRLLDVEFGDELIDDVSIEEQESDLAIKDFLPFGLEISQDVIDAEVVTEPGTSMIPRPEFSLIENSDQSTDIALRNLSERESFEPPTISAIDRPYDLLTREGALQIETTRRELLLPEAVTNERDDESSSALSVRRVTPTVVEVDAVSRASRVRRAVMIAAGVILIAWPIVLIERSWSSNKSNAAPPASANSNTKQNPASPLTDTGSAQTSNGKEASTNEASKASSSSTGGSRIRSSGSGKRVRRPQNRSSRYRGAQRLRRARR